VGCDLQPGCLADWLLTGLGQRGCQMLLSCLKECLEEIKGW
jgi:hypothetical protein